MKRRVTGLLLALTLLTALTIPAQAAGGFSDVGEDLWCRQEILDLTEAGIISGYADGTYRPYNTVTCGAALKLVLLAAGYPEQAATEAGSLGGYYDYALKKGFLDEGEVTDLRAPASRLLIARLTARALKLPELDTIHPYTDTDDGYAAALYTTGIMQGKVVNGQRVLSAEAGIKRGEMAAVVWRIRNTEWKALSRENTGLIAFQGSWYPIDASLPVNPFTADSFYESAAGYRYCAAGSRFGIDVSSHQGDIDWEAVAASGVEFAIIRAAYRGYTEGLLVEDVKFHQNMQGALAAGLDVGIYVFSQAITEAEAIEEAELALAMAEDYRLTLPVVFDCENVSSSSARTKGLSIEKLTDCAIAFAERVERSGYDAAIYFNQHLGYVRYDLSRLTEYTWWLADYNAVPAFYYGGWQLWQYTSSGKVPGIKGSVDMNVMLRRKA